jgi:hypothetical protein
MGGEEGGGEVAAFDALSCRRLLIYGQPRRYPDVTAGSLPAMAVALIAMALAPVSTELPACRSALSAKERVCAKHAAAVDCVRLRVMAGL